MNGDVLGAAIQAAVDAAVAANPTANEAQRAEIWKAIGGAIVAHVQGATVTIALGSTANGVTAGVATVPVTGSAVIT